MRYKIKIFSVLIIILCLLSPSNIIANEKQRCEKTWWLELTVVNDSGWVKDRSSHRNYSMYDSYKQCMEMLQATKIYGATGGDAQVVVILKCTSHKMLYDGRPEYIISCDQH